MLAPSRGLRRAHGLPPSLIASTALLSSPASAKAFKMDPLAALMSLFRGFLGNKKGRSGVVSPDPWSAEGLSTSKRPREGVWISCVFLPKHDVSSPSTRANRARLKRQFRQLSVRQARISSRRWWGWELIGRQRPKFLWNLVENYLKVHLHITVSPISHSWLNPTLPTSTQAEQR